MSQPSPWASSDETEVRSGAEPFYFPGNRTGVLVSHGFTGSPASVRPWGEFLAARDLTVSGPRLPGHGTRWQDMNRTVWADWYGALERAFDDLLATCDEVFVFGLSMGATLGLRLAEQRGEKVRGLVLVNPSLATERKDAMLLPLLYRFVPFFPGISNDIKKAGQDEIAYDKIPLRAMHSFTQLWSVTRADLGNVRQPMLVMRSATDHVVEPVSCRILLAEAGSTDKREIVLPDSYHVATLDNDADTIFSGELGVHSNALHPDDVTDSGTSDSGAGRRGNGFSAHRYRAVGDVDPRVGERMLDLLAAMELAAYCEPAFDEDQTLRSRTLPDRPLLRLWVEAAGLDRATEILRQESGWFEADSPSSQERPEKSISVPPEAAHSGVPGATGDGRVGDLPTDQREWDARWHDLVWRLSQSPASSDGDTPEDTGQGHLAENHETAFADPDDSEDLSSPERFGALESGGDSVAPDDEHYSPPPAPPVPRPTRPIAIGLALSLAAVLLLLFPGLLGLSRGTLTLTIAVGCLAGAAVIFARSLRETGPEEGWDDGAQV